MPHGNTIVSLLNAGMRGVIEIYIRANCFDFHFAIILTG
jgi:hypothetical protein